MTGAIYLHIPFCVKKCSYCDFNSFASSTLTLGDYTDLLSAEIEQQASIFPQLTAFTIYFGGGTPSLLSPHQVESLIGKIRSCFRLAESAEVTLEANPGTVTLESLKGYRSAGVNRLSIGVQSLQDRELLMLGRIHSANEAKSAVLLAQSAGFENIGIDLIHSLPGQSLAGWESSLQEAISLNPRHISAYGLSVEDGTPMAEMVNRGELVLPDEELSLEMFEMTKALLAGSGFEHYEISNFALPGFRSGHNQVYWRRGNYLGFGAGAHSFLREPEYGLRWGNPAGLKEYDESVRGIAAGTEGETVSRKEAMSEFFFLGLRLLDGVDLELFRTQFGMDAAEAFPGVVDRFVANGLLLRQGEQVRLSPRGLLLANQLLCEFV